MRLTRVTPPAELPVGIDLAMRHCRVDDAGEVALVQAALEGAVSWLDGRGGVLGRCLINQVWQADCARCDGHILLPFSDARDITVTGDNDAPVGFRAQDVRGRVWVTPTGGWHRGIRVRFTSGYGTRAEDVPPALRSAILLLTGFLYDNRGSAPAGDLPREVESLITPFRLRRI
ncbi:MAG: hypothetical protein Q4G36_08235 [Paracoccus sp. (in: a-proteobacteria)]|nr:hypothetical protein [Paracoccus sp. (in: a-proteobacteria)]